MLSTSFPSLRITFAVAAVLVGLFLAQGCKRDPNNAQPAAETTGSAPTEGTPVAEGSTTLRPTPSLPVNGKLKGVVEVGSSGFNSFIVAIDDNKNWKLDKADFGNSRVIEGLATGKDITEGLKNYIDTMIAKGVGSKDIHFVISSSAKDEEGIDKIVASLKTLGYVVNTVTAEEEGKYALIATLPKSYLNQAFVLDIGSGNTKMSWISNGQIQSVEAPGAKYFQKGVADEKAYQEALSAAKKIPASSGKACFILGGVPFELAKQVRNEKERYTVLKMPSEYTPEGDKQKAGINIYKAVADATGCTTFFFDWDSNFTIGFLLSL